MNQLEVSVAQRQQTVSENQFKWRIHALRGATTASQNTPDAIAQAVDELLEVIETKNQFVPADQITSVIFSVTPDLNALFPASVARQRPGWEQVPLLDVQQMQVTNSLERCIRVLIHLYIPLPQEILRPVYLRDAAQLRPDLTL